MLSQNMLGLTIHVVFHVCCNCENPALSKTAFEVFITIFTSLIMCIDI